MIRTALAVTACLALSGCGTLPQLTLADGSKKPDPAVLEAVKAILTDPNCGHYDRGTLKLGGATIGSVDITLERRCDAVAPKVIPLSDLGKP